MNSLQVIKKNTAFGRVTNFFQVVFDCKTGFPGAKGGFSLRAVSLARRSQPVVSPRRPALTASGFA
jgi:hypothetical protein